MLYGLVIRKSESPKVRKVRKKLRLAVVSFSYTEVRKSESQESPKEAATHVRPLADNVGCVEDFLSCLQLSVIEFKGK